MTVEQLIAVLQKMPQNYTVYMAFYDPRHIERHLIEKVENCDPQFHRVELSWTY